MLEYIINAAAIGVLIAIGLTSLKIVAKSLDNLTVLSKSNRTIIYNILQAFIIFTIGSFILPILGVKTQSFAFISGALVLGISLGLQKFVGNIVNGIVLLLEKTIRIHDMVQLADGRNGYVKKITLRYVLIEASDGPYIIVPNEYMISNLVTNLTLHHKKARIDIPIILDHENTHVDSIRRKILGIFKGRTEYINPTCNVDALTDRGIELKVSFWIADRTKGMSVIKNNIIVAILTMLQESNIKLSRAALTT